MSRLENSFSDSALSASPFYEHLSDWYELLTRVMSRVGLLGLLIGALQNATKEQILPSSLEVQEPNSFQLRKLRL